MVIPGSKLVAYTRPFAELLHGRASLAVRQVEPIAPHFPGVASLPWERTRSTSAGQPFSTLGRLRRSAWDLAAASGLPRAARRGAKGRREMAAGRGCPTLTGVS